MQQSIIFFDIDGTLLSETSYQVPGSTKLAIQQAKKHGHLLFVNTGRSICDIAAPIRELNFDGYICGCGTYIEYRGDVLLTNSFSKLDSLQLIQQAKDCKIDLILEGKTGTYFDDDSAIVNKIVKSIKTYSLTNNPRWTKSFDNPFLQFDKFVIWLNPDSDFETFYQAYHTSFEFIKRAEDFYEIVPLGFSKASGIEYLLRHLKLH